MGFSVPVQDIPDIVVKALKLPPQLPGTTLSCISCTDTEFMLTSWTKIEGISYSDRFRIQNVLAARTLPKGGIDVRQWGNVVWTQPLPWPHAFLGKLVERESMAEVRKQAERFARFIGKFF